MKTKYVSPWKPGLIALLFVLAAGGVMLLVGGVAAQTSVNTPDILGGREAQPGAYPWQVALVMRSQPNAAQGQFCGGSLIADDWVLTAAHCTEGVEASSIDVLVGAHRLSDSGVRITSAQIIPHPDYDPTALNNDLALIHLSTPVTYTPISLYQAISGTSELDFMRATVIGWGAKSTTGWYYDFPDALREVSLPLVDNARCARNVYFTSITDAMLCAGYETLTMGACYGDSGGPLMVQLPDATWKQVGVVSWGPPGCIATGMYDVFTRVSHFTEWIEACISNPNTLHCRGADAFEPDNYPANAQQLTGPILDQMHTFHEMGDQDWVRLEVEEGQEYLFMTGRVTTTVPLVKTVLWLFDGDGRTPITYTESTEAEWQPSENFTFEQSAHINWQADRTGPVYVSVEILPADLGQSYGPNTRYWLTISALQHSYMPVVVGPEATPTPTPIPPPANDDFDQPVAMTPLPFNHQMDTTTATTAADDPILCTASRGGATVWYRLVAPATGQIQVNTFGSSYDTVLAVYSGARGALVSLTCNDDYNSLQSQVAFDAIAGATYYIEVASYSFGNVGVSAHSTVTQDTKPVTSRSVHAGGLLNLSSAYVAGAATALGEYPPTPVPTPGAP
ncbi:MAG TPA: trypsin-like serine protease [Chloroflexi bacterium]|nr:trypsin-like serine protease [Chloroflexota bacterium]